LHRVIAAGTGTAIMSTAHRLELEVIADGAKTRAQFEFLPRAKCPKLQAGLSSRLLPPATPAAPRLQIHPAPDSEKLASWRMAGQPDPTERNRR
jgi:EAL domain-containing protein (putative c-di-GMP-specific phosphodiesterase class I)